MPESAKKFLHDKFGIGLPVQKEDRTFIDFVDDDGNKARVTQKDDLSVRLIPDLSNAVIDNHGIVSVICISLSRCQAKRLANTLNAFAATGSIGHVPEIVPEPAQPEAKPDEPDERNGVQNS